MLCPNCKQEMFRFNRFIDKDMRAYHVCRNEVCIFFGIQRTQILKE